MPADGDVVEVDGLKLQVLYTPGHTQETSIGQERQTNPFVLEELSRRQSL